MRHFYLYCCNRVFDVSRLYYVDNLNWVFRVVCAVLGTTARLPTNVYQYVVGASEFAAIDMLAGCQEPAYS